jgi:hypothetical protein
MSQIVIRVEGLGKRYRIGEGARHTALRNLIGDVLRAPARILTGSTDGSNNVLTDDLNNRPKQGLNEAPGIGSLSAARAPAQTGASRASSGRSKISASRSAKAKSSGSSGATGRKRARC